MKVNTLNVLKAVMRENLSPFINELKENTIFTVYGSYRYYCGRVNRNFSDGCSMMRCKPQIYQSCPFQCGYFIVYLVNDVIRWISSASSFLDFTKFLKVVECITYLRRVFL